MCKARSLKERHAVFTAMVALGLVGCDISPRYPVLEGNDGHSSLTRTDQAVVAATEAAQPDSANHAYEDDTPGTQRDSPAKSAQLPDMPPPAVSAGKAEPTGVRRNYDDE